MKQRSVLTSTPSGNRKTRSVGSAAIAASRRLAEGAAPNSVLWQEKASASPGGASPTLGSSVNAPRRPAGQRIAGAASPDAFAGGTGNASSLANSMWVLNVAKTGLIGLVLGSLFGAIKGTATDRGILPPELDPQPEAFDLDPTLGHMFHRLAKYRHLHEESYSTALRWCDQVLLRERELARSRRATDADYGLVETFIQGAIGHLMALRNRAPDGETRAQIQILKNEIAAILHDHRVRVRHLCASTRV